MPVIVIGADTPIGAAVIDALLLRGGEVRAFVSDVAVGVALKERSAKVAIGDLSDGSHVGSAALNAFCAVVVAEAAIDNRERSFAGDPEAVVSAWAGGLADATIKRIIVVDHPAVPVVGLAAVTAEFAVIDGRQSTQDIAARTVELEGADSI